MPASLAASGLYGTLFNDPETAALLSDSAEVRAMMLVEGTLAKVQGALGLIPADAAAYLHRASFELQIDPTGLAGETAVNGVPVPALIAAFGKAAQAPDMTKWLHWGATSQDIMETGLALRLKRVIALWDARLTALAQAFGQLALDQAETPMAARTYGQAATPTSFGAVVASWGQPILRHHNRLRALAGDMTQVSLSGAAGTLSAMGEQGPQVRADLAAALGLGDPGHSWHSERDSIAAFGAWMAGLCASLGKMGEDLILLTQSGIGEVALAGSGGSSTMPQKQNPVGPSVLVALARQSIGLSATLHGAALHRQQRDGAAWFTEWLTLPQLCISTGRAMTLAADLIPRIAVNPAAMSRGLDADGGLIWAEALTFALATRMSRPDAAAQVKALAAKVRNGDGNDNLLTLARDEWPDLDLPMGLGPKGLGPKGLGPMGLGTAPADARAFAAAALAR